MTAILVLIIIKVYCPSCPKDPNTSVLLTDQLLEMVTHLTTKYCHHLPVTRMTIPPRRGPAVVFACWAALSCMRDVVMLATSSSGFDTWLYRWAQAAEKAVMSSVRQWSGLSSRPSRFDTL